MMPWFRVHVEEIHKVVVETQADHADEAMDKIEDGDYDENTFIVDDETIDRTVNYAENVEPDDDGGPKDSE